MSVGGQRNKHDRMQRTENIVDKMTEPRVRKVQYRNKPAMTFEMTRKMPGPSEHLQKHPSVQDTVRLWANNRDSGLVERCSNP